MSARPVLVTGFEPFGRWKTNASWDLARALDGTRAAGRPVVAARLPVDYARASRALHAALDRVRPGLVVCFGIAAGARRPRLEHVALNVDHAAAPDNRGRVRRGRAIRQRGPLALASRLPLDAITRRLRRLGRAPEQSFHAGTYLCNHVFYTLLADTRLPGGFVHVPPKATPRLRREAAALVAAAAQSVFNKRK